jgi:hypothetical protein
MWEAKMKTILETGLILAAAGQLCIAILNLALIRVMRWKDDLARLPILIRQVFQIHVWFISLTLLTFAALTLRFPGEIAAGIQPVYRWIACAIGLFWAIRSVLQVTYYSSSHWRGIPSRTAVHIILLVVYPGLAALYLTAGLMR